MTRHLSPSQLAALRSRLMARGEVLRRALDSAAGRDAHELVEVTEALDRLSQATYGRCVECGNDIPWAQLNAHPQATRCTACEAGGGRA